MEKGRKEMDTFQSCRLSHSSENSTRNFQDSDEKQNNEGRLRICTFPEAMTSPAVPPAIAFQS